MCMHVFKLSMFASIKSLFFLRKHQQITSIPLDTSSTFFLWKWKEYTRNRCNLVKEIKFSSKHVKCLGSETINNMLSDERQQFLKGTILK